MILVDTFVDIHGDRNGTESIMQVEHSKADTACRGVDVLS